MRFGILTDLTRCKGCQACVWACKEINELPREDGGAKLSATTWTTIEKHNGVSVRRHCMHCLDPACVSVCPVAALKKLANGPVVYDETRCIGCRYCMVACPFNMPKYEWQSALPRVRKCIMCFEKRVKEGRQPACTEACPTGATIFGDREGLLRQAQQRIQDQPERYVDRVYGDDEAGGTSVLYLSQLPFDQVGFRVGIQKQSYPRLTWDVLSKLPNVVSVGGVLMLGIWWIVGRRDTMEKVRQGDLTIEEAFGDTGKPYGESRKPTSRDDREEGQPQ